MSVAHRSKRMRGEEAENIPLVERLVEMEDEDPEDEDVIVLPYDVVAMVFKHLCARDLCRCATVCRLWQEVAVNELASRGPISNMAPWEDVFKACQTDNFPHNLKNKPMLGLFFNGSNSINSSPRDCFSKHFPKNCVSLVMNTSGLVMDNKEYERCPLKVVYGYLPESSEVQIEYIMGRRNQVIHLNKELELLDTGDQPHRLSVIEPMFEAAADRMEGIKCMLLITADAFRHEDKLASLRVIKKKVPVMWGGVAQKLLVCKRTKNGGTSASENVQWIAVLIGGPNVKSWSIIIDREVRRKEQIRERFIEWRTSVQRMRHTVALMFSCVGRGTSTYNESDVEAGIFKEIFPNIPLIGAFGNGEFGFNFDDQRSQKAAYHQYSTSFLILTYD